MKTCIGTLKLQQKLPGTTTVLAQPAFSTTGKPMLSNPLQNIVPNPVQNIVPIPPSSRRKSPSIPVALSGTPDMHQFGQPRQQAPTSQSSNVQGPMRQSSNLQNPMNQATNRQGPMNQSRNQFSMHQSLGPRTQPLNQMHGNQMQGNLRFQMNQMNQVQGNQAFQMSFQVPSAPTPSLQRPPQAFNPAMNMHIRPVTWRAPTATGRFAAAPHPVTPANYAKQSQQATEVVIVNFQKDPFESVGICVTDTGEVDAIKSGTRAEVLNRTTLPGSHTVNRSALFGLFCIG